MTGSTKPQTKKHKVRTFFAVVAGIVGVYLILASITVVWLNRTFTNTTTYVNTVAPLITKPPVQNFLAEKVTDLMINNSSNPTAALSLLPPAFLATSPTPAQVTAALKPIIKANVLKIVQSPSFGSLWIATNRAVQSTLVSQLNQNNGQITVNLTPAVNGIITELKTTQLAPLATNVTLKPGVGVISIKSASLSNAHRLYKLYKTGSVVIIVLAVVAIGLSIWLSVHHGKTARRILMGIGILALLQALALEIPVIVKFPGADQVTQNAAHAVAKALVHNLQLANLVVGLLCIIAAIGSKLYLKYQQQPQKK